jgi:hypothetical protein
MTTVKRCIPLNNDALVFLKIGELAEAYSLLDEASITLKRAIEDEGAAFPYPCYSSKPPCGSYFIYDDLSNLEEKDNMGIPSSYQF